MKLWIEHILDFPGKVAQLIEHPDIFTYYLMLRPGLELRAELPRGRSISWANLQTSWQCWWKLLLKVRHKDRFLQTSGPFWTFCQFFKKVSTQKTKFQNFQRTCWHPQFFFKFWCKFYGHAVDKNGPSQNAYILAFICPLTFDSSTLFGSF